MGEFITGEYSLTNYGLLRADDVQLVYPQSNAYFNIQFTGEVPNELAPNQRVSIYYRITQLQELPGDNRAAERAGLQRWLAGSAATPARAPEGASCNLFRVEMVASASFICVAGDMRRIVTRTPNAHADGPSCTGGTPPTPVGGSSGGGWGGGGYSGGGYQSSGPACGPDCDKGCSCSGGCGPGSGPPPGPPPGTPPVPSCQFCYTPPDPPKRDPPKTCPK